MRCTAQQTCKRSNQERDALQYRLQVVLDPASACRARPGEDGGMHSPQNVSLGDGVYDKVETQDDGLKH